MTQFITTEVTSTAEDIDLREYRSLQALNLTYVEAEKPNAEDIRRSLTETSNPTQ